jgi:hypothetical protein
MGLPFRRGNALDIRSAKTMETHRINAATSNTSLPTSTLLPQTPKTEPTAPKFMHALTEAIETVTSKTLHSEPASLSRLVKSRSHLDLVSLNPIQTSYVPEAAALERVGKSRILPFALSG